jgi:catechol 2,3-dioxygenase-like lactoylglutathione lyase family enzyme
MPAVTGVLETSLYVGDVGRAAAFYQANFGFERLDGDDRFTALEVPGRQVLLIFARGASDQAVPLRFGTIPAHDGSGRLHVTFSIPPGEVAAWEAHLERHAVALESRVTWPRGGTSLYFRDPDGHLVELATPGLWWPK